MYARRFCPKPEALTPPMDGSSNLRLLIGQDIGVTSIQDGHGRASEEFTAGSAKLDLDGSNG
jgi:hypothetical protein